MSQEHRKVHVSDTTICMWGTASDDKETFFAIGELLKSMGFTFDFDPEVKKKYPLIAHKHFYGRRADLEFAAEFFPAGMRFDFYQNVVAKNTAGGRYDFNKLRMMPYLVRKLFELAAQRVISKAIERGFAFEDRSPKIGMDAVICSQKTWSEAHRNEFIYHPERQPAYNRKDADGNLLNNGDIRYFYDYRGNLRRGPVFYNANHMWMVLWAPDRFYSQECCNSLFQFNPAKHPRRKPRDPEAAIKAALDRAVKAKDFIRAHRINEAIERLYPPAEKVSA